VALLNIPEVSTFAAKFTYNYFLKDERINEYFPPTAATTGAQVQNLDKLPRYVTLDWSISKTNDLVYSFPDTSQMTIEEADLQGLIVVEDSFFNPSYISHTFSSVSSIEQGANDLENYSRMNQSNAESIIGMIKDQLTDQTKSTDNPYYFSRLSKAYYNLADLPKSFLGLRILDKEKKEIMDEDGILRSISNSLSLSVKINNSLASDFFQNSIDKKKNFSSLAVHSELSKTQKNDIVDLPSVDKKFLDFYPTKGLPIKIIGYIIERYRSTNEGFVLEKKFYFENSNFSKFVDQSVLYGSTYIYSIRAVASIDLLTWGDIDTVLVSRVYASSRATTFPVECYEYIPPPEPTGLDFTFNYAESNLIISWDSPANPQKDIKQYQVFRRKSIREPFELISQICFDDSLPGEGNSRYFTYEKVDPNNIDQMDRDLKRFVKISKYPIFSFVDKDFVIDTEFFEKTSYIYAICSVDAHGMISNYSEQKQVSFDPYKNKIVITSICGVGSPRPYPNMNLKLDAFKDTIRVEGQESRKMSVYLNPEYFKVKDSKNAEYETLKFESKKIKNDGPPYYLMQFINLDNQKTQVVKIKITDNRP